ncbi:MAG: hypothetical protein J0M35_04125 [Candidatus Obscuribacter phosphatis]|uniref:Uncharacterized protein n=1 Tax=Candidatus Obscuribacter phosphatis TaxID=1906157 RepID=A0A8J7TL73_9BACT|nr:hypothetical protein [Candidatus Obscuribacter phosphatis]
MKTRTFTLLRFLIASLLWVCLLSLLSPSCAFAGGVEDYLYDWSQMRKTDPNGFYLMIGGISLIVFLSLTIFGGFIYYLYKGWGEEQKSEARRVAAMRAKADADAEPEALSEPLSEAVSDKPDDASPGS